MCLEDLLENKTFILRIYDILLFWTYFTTLSSPLLLALSKFIISVLLLSSEKLVQMQLVYKQLARGT